MVVGSIPVDFSGGKREKTSRDQLLSVIDEVGVCKAGEIPTEKR